MNPLKQASECLRDSNPDLSFQLAVLADNYVETHCTRCSCPGQRAHTEILALTNGKIVIQLTLPPSQPLCPNHAQAFIKTAITNLNLTNITNECKPA